MQYQLKKLNTDDLDLMNSLLDCFGEVFEEPETYGKFRPDADYMTELLGSNMFISIVAHNKNDVIGGLAAYELQKFEQKRSEIYIYDLAVVKKCRRRGIATALIEELKRIAKSRGAWVVFVQADYIDQPAVDLYTKLGVREEVLHFDIPLEKDGTGA
ncbi:MAG: AAC(3)-I family aminoglycoside N-acetyltransferase [Candidatus Thiodiazotropha endolucinida]|nr:AAC(3)-I family aminoglycoside N-acetyltransferase [Candidatus Thiodiazotropha endolucinida]